MTQLSNKIKIIEQGDDASIVYTNPDNSTKEILFNVEGITADDLILTNVIVTTMSTDVISEKTLDAGVTVDGIKLKDGGATVITGGANTFNITNGTASLDIAVAKVLDINDNLTVTAGYGITLAAEDTAGSIVLDEQTFEVEGEGTATRLMKLRNDTDAAVTLTIGGDQDISTDSTTFTIATGLVTTLDTNVVAAGVTLAGTTLAADGTDVSIDINITPKGTGEVNIPKVDIDGGTVDGTDITVGAGKTLNVSAGTLTLADNQVSGDKVEGGTINAITINTLTGTTANITTLDTNVAAAGVTLVGKTLAADGTDAAIPITITPKGAAGIETAAGAVATPAYSFTGQADMGLYKLSSAQLGVSVGGALATLFDTDGLKSDSVQIRASYGSTPVGTVTFKEYGDGRDFTTVCTLTDFIVGALAGAAAALGVGNIVYAFPTGQHLELVSSLSSIVLTAAGTAVATDTGLGSVIASGAIATLDGTATFENRLTGQTISTAAAGGAAVSALTATTAGIGTGIALNVAASVKDVFLNSAGTWNENNTGNLLCNGIIVIKWTLMS